MTGWTHLHYVQDDEYIPYREDIETFLKREIAKPIIRWQDRPQLGYEILPNKYFYRYQPSTLVEDLRAEVWSHSSPKGRSYVSPGQRPG